MADPVRFGPGFPLPVAPVSRGMMDYNLTGSWRYLRPRYLNQIPPCRVGCPTTTDIERLLRLVNQGKISEAARLLLMENPFPGICGRVCYHPCENSCNRKGYDSALAIQLLERFVADQTRDQELDILKRDLEDKQVAVIGGGPAGMAAAYFLIRLGHQVTIFEAEQELGGILRYGIPPYRLPRDVLDTEINRILDLGIRVVTTVRVGEDIPWSDLDEFDACFLAPGLGKSRSLRILGEDAQNVEQGLDFLRRFNTGGSRDLGKRLLVVGGGNTAIDVVRTAIRAGCTDVNLLYRRSRAEMPALAKEVDEAYREGVQMHFRLMPSQIISDEDGRAIGMQVMHVQMGEADELGRARPIPIPHSERLIQADNIVVAIGEERHATALPESAALSTDNGPPRVVGVGNKPFFAGGDLANDTLTVITAIASGKRAAMAIDGALRGTEPNWEALQVVNRGYSFARYLGIKEKAHNSSIGFEKINQDYFKPQQRARTPRLTVEERISGFQEVNRGLSGHAALKEAQRCFHCGVCIACDKCYVYCPDVAIIKQPDETYDIRYEYCKGCGICVKECPRSAMQMESEESE